MRQAMLKAFCAAALLGSGCDSGNGVTQGGPPAAPGTAQEPVTEYNAIGQRLRSLGVDLGSFPVSMATDCTQYARGTVGQVTQSAAYVYCSSRQALGIGQAAPTSDVATAAKLLDLYLSAAPEIIDAVQSGKVCAGTPLFNADNTCTLEGIACVQGYPATDEQVALCSRLVGIARPTDANAALGTVAVSGIDNGKRIAVASILSAVHFAN